ncbi:protein vav isoform X2 [Macrosteles quadrilineatus]|uniref:protein vav isoform X2 n=1 Tax=Macrosteles quadrilineatus TaxID=74068 RepID=UPI0023E0FF3D|nr:protein vav isoform X2 [Macrosteles quadrilineatus]
MASIEVWRECASWLTKCGVLRPDHKANWPDASLSDLAYTLRDGVLLCNLLNSIEKGCVDMKDVNQKPQMAQFLCLRNIKTFLQVCQDVFGLKESDLFEPSMLFDLTDFYGVLYTLSKLSNCPKVLKKNIHGFSIHRSRTSSQEDIYRNLNASEEVTTLDVRTPLGEHVEYSHYDAHTRNEEIYQDLCSIDKKCTVATQPMTSHSLEKRDYVINELVETEKNYVDVLVTLQRSFMRPLSTLLEDHDYRTIFMWIKELSEIHSGFHSQLRKVVAPGSCARLSEVFLNWREKFLVYGDYCANLPDAQSRISDLCAHSDSVNQEVIRCQQEANNGKFMLRDILTVPMQRILKYPLLLEKLISETQPNHEDYRGLERAKEAMKDVAQYSNEVKRDSETLHIMKKIQESISDWDMPENTELKDYGRLIKDGWLRIKAHNDQKVKVRYVFIFDQVMLMCKALKGDQYSYKESLLLCQYKVEDVSARRTLQRDSRWNYQWYLVRKSERTAYTMYARLEEEKRLWIKAIQDALDNIEPSVCRNTDHKFLMYTFEKPSTCSHCSKLLKGRIFQGYRCDRCFIGVHKTCIPYSGRCGAKLPPELPPRPPLATTPTELVPSQPVQPVPPMPTDWTERGRSWTDHQSLREYLWFVGEMGRDRATSLLERQMDGTYLLRIRPQGPTHPNETVYALSLKTDDKVKHMKVYERDMEGSQHYYLSESRFFRTLVELISCYEHTSLGENFIGLNVRLKWPFRRIVAVADFDFNPTEGPEGANQLPLRKGCQVIVLSKEGDHKGWWKGKIQDKVGFFPKVYVREISNNFNVDLN